MLGEPGGEGEWRRHRYKSHVTRHATHVTPVLRCSVKIDHSNATAEHVDHCAAMQVCWRDILLVNWLAGYNCLVELE
jgi:hypothetical protein